MHEDLLTIGQFARLARLSVKQLRHYDELGLLSPARVDELTGYRYYRAGQARQALSIGLLRSLDVPLPVVAQVLSGTAGALEGVRAGLESELERRRRALATLERVMADGLPSAQVRIVREPARPVVVAAEQASGPGDIARATSAAVARLLATPAAGDVGDVGGGGPQLIGLFPVELSEPLTVEVALVTDGPGERTLPGGSFAAATHVGPYDQIDLTAHALLAWCAERGVAAPGPIREVYVSDPARTPPGELVTQVMVPLGEA
ncbi:MerR family transcriptional regulator [Nonomuraea soli]|uniref:DNA-binding transcriptional MerR regulator n=1 Tax=Nonomuraea soli TaxID=1032476 RepID=A0A7W0CHB0_9ACTN|nr:MerR family transcriptional regulator [Nonomuraea soli]MBA2891139.1 DNA-binding transcriptional MerR regulator [Nonomuraea soli]